MISVVALIGRSNVGKSTLFNCLTCTNDALVDRYSGLTRDRKYGYAKWEDREFLVIDTAGIENKKNTLETQIVHQSLVAIEEAKAFVKDVDDAFSLAVQSPVFDFYVAVLFQKIHYRIGCVFSFLEQKLFQLCLLLAVFRFPFPPLIARHY